MSFWRARVSFPLISRLRCSLRLAIPRVRLNRNNDTFFDNHHDRRRTRPGVLLEARRRQQKCIRLGATTLLGSMSLYVELQDLTRAHRDPAFTSASLGRATPKADTRLLARRSTSGKGIHVGLLLSVGRILSIVFGPFLALLEWTMLGEQAHSWPA